jgi:glycosyltransferase involved in cell wall biosynthesis
MGKFKVMRILFLSDLWVPFPGGAERYVFNIARELHKRGHEISILTSYESAVPGHSDFELVQELGLGGGKSKEECAEILKRCALALKYDRIIIHRYFAEQYGAIAQAWGSPVIEVVHQSKKLTNAKLYIYNTEYTRRSNGDESQQNSMVIIPPAYGNNLDGQRGDMLGFVKPLYGKGVDFLYSLADRMPDRKFLILRGAWQSCETYVEKPNITFINPVDDMKEFYSRCRITLMPSLSEDAGTIPQESAMNGIPCISSNIMGLPETNKGGIVLHHDLDQWIEHIKRLDGTAYYEMIVDRQKKIMASFDWDKKFDELDLRIRS